ncbi:MAG TPA: hypothetical protein VIJ59_06535 [Caulobacteraceae bacterium]
MTDTASPPARYANGRFGPGNPGRRAGSRNRMSHRVMMSILEEFEAPKEEILNSIRSKNAPSYFSTLMRALPRFLENDAPDVSTYSDAEAARIINQARRVLGCTTDPRQALIELEAVLSAEPEIRP